MHIITFFMHILLLRVVIVRHKKVHEMRVMLQYSKFLPVVGMYDIRRVCRLRTGRVFQINWLGVCGYFLKFFLTEKSHRLTSLSLQGLTSFHMDFYNFRVPLLILAALGKLRN